MNNKIRALLFVLTISIGSNVYLASKYLSGQKKYMYCTDMLEAFGKAALRYSNNWRRCEQERKELSD